MTGFVGINISDTRHYRLVQQHGFQCPASAPQTGPEVIRIDVERLRPEARVQVFFQIRDSGEVGCGAEPPHVAEPKLAIVIEQKSEMRMIGRMARCGLNRQLSGHAEMEQQSAYIEPCYDPFAAPIQSHEPLPQDR